MLGEKIAEFTGKVMGFRVLGTQNTHGTVPTCPATTTTGCGIEMSFEQSGKMLGIDCVERGTYFATQHPDGKSWTGTANGITTTKDGEIVTWTATGCGKNIRANAMAWRGAVYYTTTSTKLARLNGQCVVFEHETDENGVCQTRAFEWK
jgi:hypothetical protein